jgi:hypothetical protein
MKTIILASILGLMAFSSVASAKTLTFAPVTIQASAKPHKLAFKAIVINVKVKTAHVARAFASAHYSAPSACEAFTRWDGTTVMVCNGHVVSISDGITTRLVNN